MTEKNATVIHLGTRKTLSPCPFPWRRVLRRNAKIPNKEVGAAQAWLLANGWSLRVDSIGPYWADPVTADPWSLDTAVRIQATVEAGRILRGLGYTLLSGASNIRGDWTWGGSVRLKSGRVGSLLSALREAGLDV